MDDDERVVTKAYNSRTAWHRLRWHANDLLFSAGTAVPGVRVAEFRTIRHDDAAGASSSLWIAWGICAAQGFHGPQFGKEIIRLISCGAARKTEQRTSK